MRNQQLSNVLEEIVAVVTQWPSIKRVWVFGSRYKETHHKNSDLDIAVQLFPIPEEMVNFYQGNNHEYWCRHKPKLVKVLSPIVPWPLDLEWYGGEKETPCLHGFLTDCSKLIHEKS
jgi:hypothetical protein